MRYITISPLSWWKFCWRRGDIVGLMRNKEGVRPGRWGFYVLGFEVGSRDPGDPVGVWLKRHRLWPW